MDPNLPAKREETALVERPEAAPPPIAPRQDLTVALLPLAIITFLVLSFIAAAWTFLAAA